jgi:hypothetical protein
MIDGKMVYCVREQMRVSIQGSDTSIHYLGIRQKHNQIIVVEKDEYYNVLDSIELNCLKRKK